MVPGGLGLFQHHLQTRPGTVWVVFAGFSLGNHAPPGITSGVVHEEPAVLFVVGMEGHREQTFLVGGVVDWVSEVNKDFGLLCFG